MMKKTPFLIGALLLLIVANILMITTKSPVFSSTPQGFVNYMNSREGFAVLAAKARKGFPQGFRNYNEGYQNYASRAGGAQNSYQAIGPFDGIKLSTGNTVSDWRYTAPNEPLDGPEVEMGPDSLFMFRNNQCKPECCGSSFSCDGGCVCTTPSQRNFINSRGGNRTQPESGV